MDHLVIILLTIGDSESHGINANKDMNHRAKSVVRDVIEGDKSRASYLFSQPLNGVEFLLERRTCISQDLEARVRQSRKGG